jgi:riboflavin biosynthesis pyrimidine reductase
VRAAELRAERLARGEPENPAKVGVVSHVNLRPGCRFLTSGPARIILFAPVGVAASEVATLRARGVEVYATPGGSRPDASAALRTLFEMGIKRVLVEGGGTLNFELLRLGVVDEVQVFIAPLIFGGASAPTLADGAGLNRELAITLRLAAAEPWPDGGVLLSYFVQ